MAATLARHVRRQFGDLASQYRTGWRAHHQELADYLLPRRGRFFTDRSQQGGELNQRIINSNPLFAVRTLASGLLSGVTSPARPWFRLTTPDPALAEYHSVKLWLDRVTDMIHQILASGNLYTALPILYEELGVFGTAGMVVKPDFDDVVRFYPLTAGEYYIAQDERLNVRTLYRDIHMTVRQLVAEFGLENASDQVRTAYAAGNYNQAIRVGHAIEANTDDAGETGREAFSDQDIDPALKWRAVYWEITGDQDHKILRQSGHKRFPGLVPRWFTMAGEAYGRSPGMDALGDARQLQSMERVKATGLEKMVSPPMVGPMGLKSQNHSVRAGTMTYFDESQGKTIRPLYEVALPLNHLQQDIDLVMGRINRAFYVDLFMMLSQLDRRQITAREIDERHEEKLLMLGPVLERLYDDLLDPLVNFVFDEMIETGIMPEPPEEIQGAALRVELISVMAQAQKRAGVAGIDRFVGFVGGLSQLNPGVAEVLDTDRAVEAYADMLGVPARLLTPTEKLAATRQAQAEQQQQMQAMAMAQQGAATAQQGAAAVKTVAGIAPQAGAPEGAGPEGVAPASAEGPPPEGGEADQLQAALAQLMAQQGGAA